jgi:hypothetical protein
VESSLNSIHSAIDVFNRVHDKHKIETTLILLSRAWELLSKGILLKKKLPIYRNNSDHSLSGEQVVAKLSSLAIIDENQSDHIQQVISLRNEAVHGLLPEIPQEILYHIFYFCCKFFKDVICKHFKRYSDQVSTNYLSMSFENLTTYSDKVQRLVSRLRRGRKEEKRLIWLLERGIRFDGSEYISQDDFENEYKSKRRKKILPHLEIGKFIKHTEMVRVVAIQAPKNYTADIILRKGPTKDSTLPVLIKKTNIEEDFPYLTSEIARKLGKSTNFVGNCMTKLNFKGNSGYHQKIRSSQSSYLNRYSHKAYEDFKRFLENNPRYNPFKLKK